METTTYHFALTICVRGKMGLDISRKLRKLLPDILTMIIYATGIDIDHWSGDVFKSED
jgi:hypothetical protein